jgi:hypothetical protein
VDADEKERMKARIEEKLERLMEREEVRLWRIKSS